MRNLFSALKSKWALASLGLGAIIFLALICNSTPLFAADDYRYVDVGTRAITMRYDDSTDYWSYLTNPGGSGNIISTTLITSYLEKNSYVQRTSYLDWGLWIRSEDYSKLNRITGQETSWHRDSSYRGNVGYNISIYYLEQSYSRVSDNLEYQSELIKRQAYTDLEFNTPALYPGETVISATIIGTGLTSTALSGMGVMSATFKVKATDVPPAIYYVYYYGIYSRRELTLFQQYYSGYWPILRLTIGTVDTTPPSVQITSPTANDTYTTTSNSINIAGTASDNVGVTEVTWSNNRGGGGTANGTTGWSAGGIALQTGANVIIVTAKDAANNSGTDTLTVTYNLPDTTPPETTATVNPAPVNGWNNSNVTVTLNATDPGDNPSGVKEIHYSLDGQSNTTPGASASFPVTGIGPHIITFYAVDNAQPANTESPKTLTVKIGTDVMISRITNQGPNNNAHPSGDPFFTHNGELNMSVTDLTIPGRGMPFRFTRTYRSQIDFNGPLGYGWDFNYNERLIEQDNGNVLYFNGSARRDEFIKDAEQGGVPPNGGSSYTAPVGFYVELSKLPDGTFQILERDGTKKVFAASPLIPALYALRSISDRNNNQLSFQYNDNGQLVTVTDTLGRGITFNWNDKGRLSEIVDFSGRKVQYGYDEDYNLISVTAPATDEYPQGNTTAYAYSSGFEDKNLNHNLLSVTDQKNQTYITNQYNQDDRIDNQDYGTGSFQISYVSNTDNTLITTVIDRKGNKKVYYHNQLGNAIREDVYTQSFGIITTQWEYNSNGERTKTILPKGNIVEYKYDTLSVERGAQGNLLEVKRTDPVNPSYQLITLFTYEPRFNQVKSITDALNRTTNFYFDYEEAASGDLNGDNITTQANGNIVKIVYPAVTKGLSAGQIIEAKFQYNEFGQLVQSIDPQGKSNAYEYYTQYNNPAAYGYLKTITKDFNGANVSNSFEYDAVGNITAIYDGKGNKTAFTVNALNQVTATLSRLGHSVRFHYDANGNIDRLEVENKGGDGISNPDLPWITSTYNYDILDNLVSKAEQVSAAKTITTQYGYDQNGNRDLITQPETNQFKNYYDERNLLVETIRGYGTVDWTSVKRRYDLNGNLKEIIDGRGKMTEYLVDGFDRMTGYVDALGNRMEQDVDAVGNVTRVVRKDAQGVILSEAKYLYDELNRNYETQTWLNTTNGWVITRNEFDKNSRVVRTIDANNHQRLIEYDGLGRVKSTTDALGNKVEYTYDSNSNVTVVTESETPLYQEGQGGVYITSNQYDNLDRLIRSINPIGVIRGYSFDSRNNLVSSIDGEGNTTSNAFDGVNRLISVIRDIRENGKGTGNIIKQIKTQYQWDDNSRLTSLTDDNQNLTHYQYDALNRRKAEYLADGTHKDLLYDASDNIEKITDANGTQITQGFDNINRLTRKDIVKGIGVIGISHEEFGYDGLSRMTSAINDYSQVAMRYDSLSRLLEESQSMESACTERSERVVAKSVVSAYDIVGNRTGLTYPNGKVVNFVPDDLNRIKQIKDASNNIIAQYNYAGPFRVTNRDYLNGVGLSVTYDGNRRVTGYQHQKSASAIAGFAYAYDKEDNKLFEKRTHEGKGDAFVYDSIYRLTGVKYGVPNLNATTDYADYTDYKSKEDFTLDGVGNRQTLTTNLLPTTYSVNNLNQYTGINGSPLTYDKNGNLLSRRIPLMTHLKERFGISDWSKRRDGYKNDDKCEDEDDDEGEDALDDLENDVRECGVDRDRQPPVEMEWQYAYDYANRLMQVKKAFYVKGRFVFTREVTSYTYDALGRRIKKEVSNKIIEVKGKSNGWDKGSQRGLSSLTTHFYYDGARVIEEYKLDKRNSQELSAQYVYGNGIDEVLAMTRYKDGCGKNKGKTYYYHENALGSIYAITNDKGKVVERYEYEAYGEVTITGPAGRGKRNHSTIGNRFMFTGREYDSETGLYYYRARYYSAEMGRFLSRDPIGYMAGVNLYTYVNNRPLMFIDPYGLEGASWWNPLGWPGEIVWGVGWVSEQSGIPIIMQTGQTIQSIGEVAESPATIVEGVVTLSGGKIESGGGQLLEGSLGTIGLGAIAEEWVSPSTASSIFVPVRFAEAIVEADSRIDREKGRSGGMKNWHAASFFGMTNASGITELPWLWLGGVFHEIDPRSIQAEYGKGCSDPNAQGAWVILDSPGDIVANTLGMITGLLIPKTESTQRIVGETIRIIIPGPPDPGKW